jgi:hypothetical protein
MRHYNYVWLSWLLHTISCNAFSWCTFRSGVEYADEVAGIQGSELPGSSRCYPHDKSPHTVFSSRQSCPEDPWSTKRQVCRRCHLHYVFRVDDTKLSPIYLLGSVPAQRGPQPLRPCMNSRRIPLVYRVRNTSRRLRKAD